MINLDNPQQMREMMQTGVSGLKACGDIREKVGRKIRRRRQTRAVLASLAIFFVIGGSVLLAGRPSSQEGMMYILEAGGGPVTVVTPGIEQTEFLISLEEENHAILLLSDELYRMVGYVSTKPSQDTAIGTVQMNTENPYDRNSNAGQWVSNAVEEGQMVYRIENLPASTAVLASVDGQMALFQRTSSHGYGLNGDSLEMTLSVRDQVSEITIDGIGTLTGDAAKQVVACLLDTARLASAEAMPGTQTLTIQLSNGMHLSLSVDGDQLIGCGVWECGEFLDLFRNLVAARADEQRA